MKIEQNVSLLYSYVKVGDVLESQGELWKVVQLTGTHTATVIHITGWQKRWLKLKKKIRSLFPPFFWLKIRLKIELFFSIIKNYGK